MDKLNSEQKKSCLRKSVSSYEFNSESCNTNIKEAKSFTGALPELTSANSSDDCCPQYDNYPLKIFAEEEEGLKENGYITKEISSDNIFLVRHEMLNYRGHQYSLSDIATRWKKDCRMWLWKNKENKSMSELNEKTKNLHLHSRKP